MKLFKKFITEQAEELDELSGKTAQRYYDKAGKDYEHSANNMFHSGMGRDRPLKKSIAKRFDKRTKGLERLHRMQQKGKYKNVKMENVARQAALNAHQRHSKNVKRLSVEEGAINELSLNTLSRYTDKVADKHSGYTKTGAPNPNYSAPSAKRKAGVSRALAKIHSKLLNKSKKRD